MFAAALAMLPPSDFVLCASPFVLPIAPEAFTTDRDWSMPVHLYNVLDSHDPAFECGQFNKGERAALNASISRAVPFHRLVETGALVAQWREILEIDSGEANNNIGSQHRLAASGRVHTLIRIIGTLICGIAYSGVA
jgi:hypothetical protein